MKTIIYDIEIDKAILGKNESVIEGVEYCDGWHDHAGMGISCIGVYDYVEDRHRVFFKDNIVEFIKLCVNRDLIVGFNSYNFDNKVVEATFRSLVSFYELDFSVKTYDILRNIWQSLGLNPDGFNPKTHGGYGLDACCEANFGIKKSGHGAKAPIDFQQGKYGSLVDYCLNDVRLTKKLFDHIQKYGYILNPKLLGDVIFMERSPGLRAANKTAGVKL